MVLMNEEIKRLIDLEYQIYKSNFVEQAAISYMKTQGAINAGLSDVEFLMITILTSNGQGLIQRMLYNGGTPTVLEQELWRYLDSALDKLPIEDHTKVVYRVLSNTDISTNQIGNIIEAPYYMTASLKELNTKETIVYEIMLAARTKAKSIYRVFEIMPQVPEFQVEFPRNTKFLVYNITEIDGKTRVELIEQPEHELPVEKLTLNVTDFFRHIKAINIQDAINRGLQQRIFMMKTVCGDEINACCCENGYVLVSPTYAQAIWNLCYVGLWLSDHKMMEEGFEAEGSSLGREYENIVANGYHDEGRLYIKSVVEAEEWREMLMIGNLFRHNIYTESDVKYMGNINLEDPFVKKVCSLYCTAMGGVLLHELNHKYFGHYEPDDYRPQKVKEQEADDKSFEAILAIEDEKWRKTAVLGALCPYLLAFYTNCQLKPHSNYYDTDDRLFRQYDKINDKEMKQTASIFVSNVLGQWLDNMHHVNVEVRNGHEIEAVEEMRSEIREIKRED